MRIPVGDMDVLTTTTRMRRTREIWLTQVFSNQIETYIIYVK